MKITYYMLKQLIQLNPEMKLKFIENSNTLQIFHYHDILLTLELPTKNIEENSELIYSAIIQLQNISMYIPKIYLKEN